MCLEDRRCDLATVPRSTSAQVNRRTVQPRATRAILPRHDPVERPPASRVLRTRRPRSRASAPGSWRRAGRRIVLRARPRVGTAGRRDRGARATTQKSDLQHALLGRRGEQSLVEELAITPVPLRPGRPSASRSRRRRLSVKSAGSRAPAPSARSTDQVERTQVRGRRAFAIGSVSGRPSRITASPGCRSRIRWTMAGGRTRLVAWPPDRHLDVPAGWIRPQSSAADRWDTTPVGRERRRAAPPGARLTGTGQPEHPRLHRHRGGRRATQRPSTRPEHR